MQISVINSSSQVVLAPHLLLRFDLSPFGRRRRVWMVSRRIVCGRLTPCNLKYRPHALQTISPRRLRLQMVVVVVPQFVQDKSFCELCWLLLALFGLLLLLFLVRSSEPVHKWLPEVSGISPEAVARGDDPPIIFLPVASWRPDRLGHVCFRRPPACF